MRVCSEHGDNSNVCESAGCFGPSETYLGDGLYASFDGYQIGLRAPRGPDGDHRVFLNPQTLAALTRYVEALRRDQEHGLR